MPNILDVVTLQPVSRSTKAEKAAAELVARGAEVHSFLESISAGAATRELLAKVSERVGDIRRAAFAERLTLSGDLARPASVDVRGGRLVAHAQHFGDELTRLSGRAQSTLAHLRRVADMLGMVIMPFAALNQRSIAAETYAVRRWIGEFCSDAGKAGLDAYVVAPLRLYSIEQHVAASGPDELYSKTHEATLNTVLLQLPLFRTFAGAITGLETRVSALESAHAQMKTQITALEGRLIKLEEQVAQAKAEAWAAKQEAERQAAAPAPAFLALDPLLFAVKRGTSLTDDGPALVGPAWGPDFSEAMLEASGLSVIAGQRKKIEAKQAVS